MIPRSLTTSPANPEISSRHVLLASSRRRIEKQQQQPADQSSDAQIEASTEHEEEDSSTTSQESSDEASKYVAHHIDGYGSITSCNDDHSRSAGRDIESSTGRAPSDYETIELEIKFDYQMELISLASEENRSDAYDELIASTERAMHEVMVDGFLHCGSPGATERHGMDRKRHLTTVAESQPPSPRIVGISSAPQDAISLEDSCTSFHTTKDACVVVHAAATVTLEMTGIINSKLLSAAIDTIRSSILKKIEADMQQGKYDERYGRNLFAKISFKSRSSLTEEEVGHDYSETVATSLRGEAPTRHRRHNMRAIVVAIGMITIAIVFKLISYNKNIRSKRSGAKGDKKSWRMRSSVDNSGNARNKKDTNERGEKKQAKMAIYESFGGDSASNASVIVEEEEEEDKSQSDDFEENESIQMSIKSDDDDDWTYDAIGRQASLEMLDLESGAGVPAAVAGDESMNDVSTPPFASNSKLSHFRAVRAFLDREARESNNIKGTASLQMMANGQIRIGFEEAWETFEN